MKTKLKLFLSAVAALVCTAVIVSAAYAESEKLTYNGFTYEITDTNEITIIKGPDRLTSVAVPEEINNLPVTAIGNDAFYGCKNIPAITLPSGVKSIGSSAFSGCSKLASINIPDRVTEIASLTFYNCGALEAIQLPNGVTSIGSSAFSGCSKMTSIALPDGVVSIGKNAFYNCQKFTNISLPSGLTVINDSTFSLCSSLKEITFSNNVKSVEKSAFYYCSALTDVYFYGSAEDWINITIKSDNSSLKNANITYLAAVTYTGDYAGTASVVRGENAVLPTPPEGYVYDFDVNGEAWYEKNINDDVTVNVSMTKLHTVTFIGVLTDTVQVRSGASVSLPSGDGFRYAFTADGKEWDGKCVTDDITVTVTKYLVIASGKCGENAEYSLYDDGLLIIDGTGAMYAYTGNSNKAPWQNADVKSVIVSGGITSIGNYAFYNCLSLNKVHLCASVASVSDTAFLYCPTLESISVDDSNEHYCSIDGNLYSKDKTTLVKYASGKNDASFTVPNGTLSVGNYAFSHSEKLTSTVLPDGIESIGAYAFQHSALTEITMPDSVTHVGEFAFYWCSNLTDVKFSARLSSLGGRAFYLCTSLANVVLPDGLTSVNALTFANCSMLASVALPMSVTTINSEAFLYCHNLRNVYFGGTETQWKRINIVSGNEALTSAKINFAVSGAYVTGEKSTPIVEGDTVSFECNLTSSVPGADLCGTFYFAAYAENGRLLQVYTENIDTVNSEYAVSASFTVRETPNYFKAFFWGGNSGVEPLAVLN